LIKTGLALVTIVRDARRWVTQHNLVGGGLLAKAQRGLLHSKAVLTAGPHLYKIDMYPKLPSILPNSGQNMLKGVTLICLDRGIVKLFI